MRIAYDTSSANSSNFSGYCLALGAKTKKFFVTCHSHTMKSMQCFCSRTCWHLYRQGKMAIFLLGVTCLEDVASCGFSPKFLKLSVHGKGCMTVLIRLYLCLVHFRLPNNKTTIRDQRDEEGRWNRQAALVPSIDIVEASIRFQCRGDKAAGVLNRIQETKAFSNARAPSL